jgi:hypothetical protein
MYLSPFRFITLMGLLIFLSACSALPFFNAAPTPVNRLAYDAPVSLSIKNGSILPGTMIAYTGKADNGAAKILIAGLLAPKQVADTVDWEGTPAPNVSLRLNTRVAAYDDQSITLIGTAHVDIASVTVQPGGTPGPALIEFGAPVTFSLKPNEIVPGTNLAYAGATTNGAQFLGLEGYPYRKQLDSLQYVGRLNQKVFLRFDLRVVNYSDTNVVLGGTANIRVEQ